MNFFRPVRKLVSKERVGAKVSKRYDEPATPYQRLLRQRLLASGCLTDSARTELERQYLASNPAQLQARIDRPASSGALATRATGAEPSEGGWVTLLLRHRFPFGNDYF